MKFERSNVQNIKIRPLIIDDFEYILEWSKDDTFCSANDWEKIETCKSYIDGGNTV
jgi:hypothetical protein